MSYLMVTRFNNDTLSQNIRWKENNNYTGCIYNTPVKVINNIPLLKNLYVIEMNNSINKVMGIGRLKNKLYFNKKYNIYDDQNYNRYTYKGKKYIDKDQIPKDLLEKLEKRLFTTKKHLKRGQGIQQVRPDIKEHLKTIEQLFI